MGENGQPVLDLVHQTLAKIQRLERLVQDQAKEIATLKDCLREGK